MAAMVTVKCENCEVMFEARVADRKRGWGRFHSKSCKASTQSKKASRHRPTEYIGLATDLGLDMELGIDMELDTLY